MSKIRGSDIPHKCVICAGALKPHERAEQFCDRCLRAAQTQPILQHDKEGDR